jgi:D-alanyl-D-alanine carboxypeptidase
MVDSVFKENPTSIGIMVHVESPGRGLSWSGSAGYADSEEKTELMPDQPALIASSIKPYISATILRLQELGKLSIEDPVRDRLSKETIELFESDGYVLNRIKIKNLLSHTSGIEGYDKMEFLDWIGDNPTYRWSRDGLLIQAVKMGDPLGSPEDVYNYADANYLLCTEIIEVVTNKPFYIAIRELLKYDEFDFDDTWFPTLEEQNKNTKPLIHQYWGEKNWDSYEIDISWDLYGGGGIATTTEEISKFYYNLFAGRIIEDESTLNQIFTEVKTKDGNDRKYFLGVSEGNVKGYKSYGHGGFWSTVAAYFPELDTSIAIFVSERDKRGLRQEIVDLIVGILIE